MKHIRLIISSMVWVLSIGFGSTLVRSNVDPITLDPSFAEDSPSIVFLRDLFEPLMAMDRNSHPIPGMAESYTRSADGLTYVFTLRKEARWSDGSPVLASDFEFAFKRAVDPSNRLNYAFYFKAMHLRNLEAIIEGKKSLDMLGVKALDARHVRLQLEQKVPYLLNLLTYTVTSPVPSKVVRRYGDTWTQPGHMITNGAYVLEKWESKKHELVMKKNAYYYDKSHVAYDHVRYLNSPSESVMLERYFKGEVEYLSELPRNRIANLRKSHPKEIKHIFNAGIYYCNFDTRHPPFNDIRLRKALSFAIDREVLAYKVMGSGEIPRFTFVPSTISGYVPPIPPYQKRNQQENEAQAKALFAQSGYNDTHPLHFQLLYNESERNTRMLLAVITMWKRLFGEAIDIKLTVKPWAEYLHMSDSGSYDMIKSAWAGDYDDASTFLTVFRKGHPSNNSFYDNAHYETLLSLTEKIDERKQRNINYQKLDAMLTEDMIIIPLFEFSSSRMVKPYIGGYPERNVLDAILSKYLYPLPRQQK